MRATTILCVLLAICYVQADEPESDQKAVQELMSKINDKINNVIQDLGKYAKDYKIRMNDKLNKPSSEATSRICNNITYLLLQIQAKANKYNVPCFEISRSALLALQAQGAAAVEKCAEDTLGKVDLALDKILAIIQVARRILTDFEAIVPKCQHRIQEETDKCILWRLSETNDARDSLEHSANITKNIAENTINDALAWNRNCNKYQVTDFQKRTCEIKYITDGCMIKSDRMQITSQ